MKYLTLFLVCFAYIVRALHAIQKQDQFYVKNRR